VRTAVSGPSVGLGGPPGRWSGRSASVGIFVIAGVASTALAVYALTLPVRPRSAERNLSR
jgi:hypothetical protein